MSPASVGADLGEGEADIRESVDVLVSGVREVSAGYLRRALQQVPDRGGWPEMAPVVRGPSEVTTQGCDEERRVGDPAGDDDIGPGLQRGQNLVRTEVGVGSDEGAADFPDGHAFVERRVGSERFRHVVAEQGRHHEPVETQPPCHLDGALGRRPRVRDSHVGDHPRAARKGERQNRAHAPLQ